MTLSSMGNIRKTSGSQNGKIIFKNRLISQALPSNFSLPLARTQFQFVNISVTIVNYNHNKSAILKIDKITPDGNFENIRSKCAKLNAEHPATGRFSTIVLFGDECA